MMSIGVPALVLGALLSPRGNWQATAQSLPPMPTMNGTDSNPADLPVVDLGYEIHRASYLNVRRAYTYYEN